MPINIKKYKDWLQTRLIEKVADESMRKWLNKYEDLIHTNHLGDVPDPEIIAEEDPPKPVIEKFKGDNTMRGWFNHYEEWIRSCLPKELSNQPIDFFSNYYLDGLTVMSPPERSEPAHRIFEPQNKEDLCYWMLAHVCRFIKEVAPAPRKIWRYYRHHAEDGQWYYTEHRNYDYNAIEDPRLYGFECFLRNLKAGFPQNRWEEEVQSHIALMNYWYNVPHWDYDRQKLCFIEISDSKEYDAHGGPDEPRPGSIINVVD